MPVQSGVVHRSSRPDRDGAVPPSAVGAALVGLELFHGVDPTLVEPLVRDCSMRSIDAGEVLIEAGRPNDRLFLLLDGELEVHLHAVSETFLVRIGAGESVGELSLIDGKPSSAYVVASRTSRVLEIDEELLWLLASTSHAIATNLLSVLARRMRNDHALISEGRRHIEQYRFEATIDALTGLYNRHWLDRMLPRQVERSWRGGVALSVLLLDIDHFKRVNDEHGHLAGDEVLRSVARTLRENLRALDLPARFGGEEFVVVCPGLPGPEALALAERLRSAVAAVPIPAGSSVELHVSVSVGVRTLDGERSARSLIQGADEALYRAKAAGRDRVSD